MKAILYTWVKVLATLAVLVVAVTFLIKPTIVKNYSMSPTLEENDIILIYKDGLLKKNSPKKGDIIVFKSSLKTVNGSDKLLIKRVIALPGDNILINDGSVYLNESILEEEYLYYPYTDGEIILTVPSGKIFVMGDNRFKSLDSRDNDVGLVPLDEVLGRAFYRLYPFRRMGLIN